MWFKLAGATFSTHLGPMSKLSSSISIKYNANGFNYITGSVSKDDASASLVLTLNSNYTYEHSDSNVTVTGATKGSISYSNGTLTIPITPSSGSTCGASEVSSINVTVTGAVSSGGSEGGEPDTPVNPPSGDTPTATTWYVNAATTSLGTDCATSNTSYGWIYGDASEQAAIRDKYINAIQFVTTATSGTVTIGIADEANVDTVHSVQTTTFNKSGTSKEIVTAVFATPFKLTGNQLLVFEPSNVSQRNYNHYFGAQGSAAKSFISRVPIDKAGGASWKLNTGNTIGISVGYYVEGSVEEKQENNNIEGGLFSFFKRLFN